MSQMKAPAVRGRVVDDLEVKLTDSTKQPMRVGLRPETSMPCSPNVPMESLISYESFNPSHMKVEGEKTFRLKMQ